MKPRLVIPIAHNSSPPNDDGTGEQITASSSAADETELAALQTRLHAGP